MSVGVQRRRLWPILVTAVWAGWCLRCTVAVAQEADGAGPAPKGVVIEQVGEGSALEKAGLEPGDVVWAWERLPNPPANPEAARGKIESVFDWLWLEVEQASRGTVKLFGDREGMDVEAHAIPSPSRPFWPHYTVFG